MHPSWPKSQITRVTAVLARLALVATTAKLVLSTIPATFAGETNSASPGARWLGVDGASVSAFNKLTGAKARVKLRFCNWTQSWGNKFSFTAAAIAQDASEGAATMMSWGPNDNCPNILTGKYDTYLHQWAKEAAADKRPFLLRLAWEANGFWYPWCYGGDKPKSTPEEFARMWRHVHEIFVAEEAHNVKWVWCPNSANGPIIDFAKAYPGDNYVDYTGLDSYNFGKSQKDGRWHTFSDCFKRSYDRVTSLTSKPLIVCETASTELGGDKAAWIATAFQNDIPNTMPKIVGLVWFNENKETDWRVNSSPQALKAFQDAVQAPAWQAPFRLAP